MRDAIIDQGKREVMDAIRDDTYKAIEARLAELEEQVTAANKATACAEALAQELRRREHEATRRATVLKEARARIANELSMEQEVWAQEAVYNNTRYNTEIQGLRDRL